MSVADLLRNTECVYNQIKKYIPKKLERFDYDALQKANLDKTKHEITIKDLKSRHFPHKFFVDKNYPVVELIKAGYFHFKLIENGFTFKDMKDAGISLKDLKLISGYGRVPDKNTPEILKAIKDAGYTIQEFYESSFPLDGIVKAGFNLQEIWDSDIFRIEEIEQAFGDNVKDQITDKKYTKEEILTAIKDESGNYIYEKLRYIICQRYKRK